MAGPSTLPGPLGQVDRIRYGTRLNVFWYGESNKPKSSKAPQNDLSIDLGGSGWYETIVVNHPVERTICGRDVKIVVLVDLNKDTHVASDGVWVDVLSDATYGDDFCGGKMWHFSQEHKIGTLDAWKDKCKASDLNTDKIKAYLDARNRAWEMYDVFNAVFAAGSEAPLWPPSSMPMMAPPTAPLAHPLASFASPVPASLPPSAVIVTPAPPPTIFVPSADAGTERYEIELLAAKIRQDVYKGGEAIQKSKTRLCTVCVFEKRTDIKNGVMVPACLLGDRKYFDEQDGVAFRFFKSKKDPSMYNGFSVCTSCAADASNVYFLRIDETNKRCIICLGHVRSDATMLCKPCGEQVAPGKDESIVMDHLLDMLPHMFPHYKIRMPNRREAKFEVCDYKIDYHFDAQYYDGLSKKWKKIKFLFELDQRSHAGYDLWTEKTRLVRVLRGSLEAHDKVVMLRLNHTEKFVFPLGFSEDDVKQATLDQATFHMRFLVLRHWVLYFLQNAADLPAASLLYLYYRYQSAYDAKYGKDKDERAALVQEDDITQDSGPTPPGQERLPPLWKHACTGFAFSSPPVRETADQVNWRYYVTSGEYKDCNPGSTAAAIGPTLVGKMQAACERAHYEPFPLGLRSDMPKFPSVVSKDEAFAPQTKTNKKAKKA